MKNPVKDAGRRVGEKAGRIAKKVKKRVEEARLDTGDAGAPLGERTKQQLYNRARELGISGRSKMSKGQLVAAIRRAQ